MSFSIPNLFTHNKIENVLYRIFKKHKLRFENANENTTFVTVIEVNYNMFFELYDECSYITFKGTMSHIRFDNDHPNDIYNAAEMIGFLQGGTH